MRNKEKEQDFFQERVDELLCIEKRADRRAETLQKIVETFRKTYHAHLDTENNHDKIIQEQYRTMIQSVNTIQRTVESAAVVNRRSIRLFVGSILLSFCVVVGAISYAYHVNSQLAIVLFKLDVFTDKLHHTPIIFPMNGRLYVEVTSRAPIKTTSKNTKNKKKSHDAWYAEIVPAG